jgi:hypothetical protein
VEVEALNSGCEFSRVSVFSRCESLVGASLQWVHTGVGRMHTKPRMQNILNQGLSHSLFDYIHPAIDRCLVSKNSRDGHPPPFATRDYFAGRTDQNLLHDKNTLIPSSHTPSSHYPPAQKLGNHRCSAEQTRDPSHPALPFPPQVAWPLLSHHPQEVPPEARPRHQSPSPASSA